MRALGRAGCSRGRAGGRDPASHRGGPGAEPAVRGLKPKRGGRRKPAKASLHPPPSRPERDLEKRPPPQGPVAAELVTAAPAAPGPSSTSLEASPGPRRRPLALPRPSAPLTQKMRLRNTSTVLEEVMPHWPMVPAARWGPARRAGGAHRARRQWRRRLSTGNCTAYAALTAAPGAVAQPRPQQAPRFFAQPPQIPRLPAPLLGNRVPPPTASASHSRGSYSEATPLKGVEDSAPALGLWPPLDAQGSSGKFQRNKPTALLLSYASLIDDSERCLSV